MPALPADSDRKCHVPLLKGGNLQRMPPNRREAAIESAITVRFLLTVFGRHLAESSRALLVQRVKGQDARFGVGANAQRVDANHRVLLGAKAADPGLVDCVRNRPDREA